MSFSRQTLAYCAFLMLVASSPQGWAFSGSEHYAVSSDGLRLAIDALQARGCDLSSRDAAVVEYLLDGSKAANYGSLVNSIDYLVNQIKPLQMRGGGDQFPQTPDDLDEFLVDQVMNQSLAKLRAKTVNETHFQAELTSGIRFWHQAAVLMAAYGETPNASLFATPQLERFLFPDERKGNLMTALMLNAIGDHYLQDFFAPGHIFTERFGMHDAVAGTLHNTYNVLGARFEVDALRWRSDLAPLLAEVSDEWMLLVGFSVDEIADIRMRGLSEANLWGDSNMIAPDGRWDAPHQSEARRQRLLMTLIEARSILDVLLSYCQGQPVNHFEGVGFVPRKALDEDWSWRDAIDAALCQKQTFVAPEAFLPMGRYRFPAAYERCAYSGMIYQLNLATESISGSDTRTARHGGEFGLVIAAGRQLKVEDETRMIRPRSRQGAATLLYSYSAGGDQSAHGPKVMLLRSSPLVHMQYGVELGYRTYEHENASEQKWSYGLVYQLGFSLLTMDLRFGRDFAYDGIGNLTEGNSLRAGISIVGPFLGTPVVGAPEFSMFRNIRKRAFAEKRPDPPAAER